MSKSNYLETVLLQAVFNADALPFNADTNVYVALHTADPGEAGTQDTNEVTYTGYSRVAVARTSSGWAVVGNMAANVTDITWPLCSGGSDVATHFSIGRLATGAGELLYSGEITTPLIISSNIIPVAAASALTVTEQ